MNNKDARIAWLKEELTVAYVKARAGKTKKPQVVAFDKVAKAEICSLANEIYTRTYLPRPSTAFIINKPVKREIFAADFRDRIVHHFLFNQVNPWWNNHFIEDSYSCRAGKGTLYGIRRLDHHIRSESHNYTRPAYILKLDIKGYFMSLNRKKLYERVMRGLDRQFPDKGFVYRVCGYLWRIIIFNDPLKNAVFGCPRSAWRGLPSSKSLFKQPQGQGIAIGNLTSQLLSNIYLDQLDRYITLRLGCKHYGRYVDDFYIVLNNKQKLMELVPVIELYLSNVLKLTLHPRKRYLQECHNGVSFLGAVVYPYRLFPGRRLKRNLCAALSQPTCAHATDMSYRGLVKYYKHYKLLQQFPLH